MTASVDMSKPVYVTLYGDRTKQYGYGRLRPATHRPSGWSSSTRT
jgi:hypothetical protein